MLLVSERRRSRRAPGRDPREASLGERSNQVTDRATRRAEEEGGDNASRLRNTTK
jgi:hypothetical protein